MTLNGKSAGNNTTRRIVAGVVIAVTVALCTAVIVDRSRVAVLENQMATIERTLETNRVENNQAHGKMGDQLAEVLKEVAKK